VTKYSRIPSEEIAFLRYGAMMEIGKETLIFDAKWVELVWIALKKQAEKLWISIIAGNVLPDHVHIIIDAKDIPIPEIVKKLKWYSSYKYNRTFDHKWSVWAVWYSNTYLNNERYLENTVEYIQNNHFKHNAKSYYVL